MVSQRSDVPRQRTRIPPSHVDAADLLREFGKEPKRICGVHVDAVLWTDKDDNPWTTFIEVEAEDGVIKRRNYRTFAGFVSHSD
jgi:hypothetical protein